MNLVAHEEVLGCQPAVRRASLPLALLEKHLPMPTQTGGREANGHSALAECLPWGGEEQNRDTHNHPYATDRHSAPHQFLLAQDESNESARP
jgi:hypothetical protein